MMSQVTPEMPFICSNCPQIIITLYIQKSLTFIFAYQQGISLIAKNLTLMHFYKQKDLVI